MDMSDIDPDVFYNSIERTDPEWFVWRIVYEQSLGEISLYIDNDPTPVLQSDGWAGGGGNSLVTSNQSRESSHTRRRKELVLVRPTVEVGPKAGELCSTR